LAQRGERDGHGPDGRRTVVTASRLRRYKAWLAWRRMDRPDFVVVPRRLGGAPQPAAPIYLIWDTRAFPDVRADGQSGWLPAATSFDLTEGQGDLEALSLPADASPAALRGLALFKTHCAACHSIDGHGGVSGPELNAPVSVTAYIARPWLVRWIDRPQAVRARAAMPPFGLQGPERGAAIDDIIAFLVEVADRRPAR